MTTNTTTLTIPVGSTRDGETLTIDLRRTSAVLVAGIAGSGKSAMLARMRYALERQIGIDLLLHAGGIRANADGVILAARDELRRRRKSRADDAAPAVLVVDDFGVMCIGRDRGDKTVRAVEEIAVRGRAADVHLVLATQGREGIDGRLLMNLSPRIVLGRIVTPISHLFSDEERELITDISTNPTGPGDGVLIGADGNPVAFTALPLGKTGRPSP